MQHIHLACAMICNQEGDLLVVRKTGSSFYMLPGGKIETNETAIAALLRELDEELGFQLQQADFVFLGQHQTQAANEANTYVLGNMFRLKQVINSTIQVQAELAEAVWISRESYTNYKLAHLLQEFALPRWLAGSAAI